MERNQQPSSPPSSNQTSFEQWQCASLHRSSSWRRQAVAAPDSDPTFPVGAAVCFSHSATCFSSTEPSHGRQQQWQWQPKEEQREEHEREKKPEWEPVLENRAN